METNDKFFNAYVDLAVGMLHQNVNTILELKTQIKLLEDNVRLKDSVISELDGAIGVLNEEKKNRSSDLDKVYLEKEEIRSELSQQIEILNSKLASMEEKYEQMQQKYVHMATYETQIKEMKRELQAKNEEIDQLKKQSEKPLPIKESVKEDINIKNIVANKKIQQKKTELITDDF